MKGTGGHNHKQKKVTQMAATKASKSKGSRRIPDPEMKEKRPRKKFTTGYKLQILKEAETCSKPGELGALLRREGLYSSHITRWRREYDQGIQDGLGPKKRGRKENDQQDLLERIRQLESDNEKLRRQLKQAQIIVEAQKKISELMALSARE